MATKVGSSSIRKMPPELLTVKQDDKADGIFKAVAQPSAKAQRRMQNKAKYLSGGDPVFICERVFSVFNKMFPFRVNAVLKSYIVGDREEIFEECFDLTKTRALQKYLSIACRTPEHLGALRAVVARVYETELRDVIGDKMLAKVFPVFSEVVGYALQLLQGPGQKVLEIGAASGEISAILAFSNAARLYVNDINYYEMQQFEKMKKTLPHNVQRKLVPLNESCFDLLKKHSDLKNALDLVIGRNVVHCFDEAEQKEFFRLMHNVLKSGGRGIITGNCIYYESNAPQMLASAQKAVSFTKVVCKAVNIKIGNGEQLCSRLSLPSTTVRTPSYRVKRLYECTPATHFTWKRLQSSFDLLDPGIRMKIEEIIEERRELFQMEHGCIDVEFHERQCYSEHTFSRLVESYGFEIEEVFLIDDRGHLISEDGDKREAQEVGAIFKKHL